MKVGARIARARDAMGLSQAQLAKRIGVPAGTLASWEAGWHGVGKDRIAKVAKVLGLDVAELLA